MNRQFIIDNARERTRLHNLVKSLTDEELNSVIYKEGWTIAVVLAHLAFGDRRTLALVQKWKQIGVAREPPTDIDPINDALLPLFLAIPSRIAADLVISSSEAVDLELENASPEFIEQMEKIAPRRLQRSIHRSRHLDEIEAFLETTRNSR